MFPRAVLFSSNEGIAEVLIPVFAEFGIEIEQCGEIFAAVERMTAGGFEAVIADWSEDLEATFFLKTARELKCVKSAFALAVVEQKDVDEAFKLGIDGVLIRPLTSEQVRNALSTVGRFKAAHEVSPVPETDVVFPARDRIDETSKLPTACDGLALV